MINANNRFDAIVIGEDLLVPLPPQSWPSEVIVLPFSSETTSHASMSVNLLSRSAIPSWKRSACFPRCMQATSRKKYGVQFINEAGKLLSHFVFRSTILRAFSNLASSKKRVRQNDDRQREGKRVKSTKEHVYWTVSGWPKSDGRSG